MPGRDSQSNAAIRLKSIDKWFGTVHANRDVSLTIEKGRIHGIVGENGAGKSTLMNIVYGFYQPDRGSIAVHGQPVALGRPSDAIAHGIGMVHQHFMLVETFTVLENILLGAEKGWRLEKSIPAARSRLLEIEREYGLKVDLDVRIGDLPVGIQQRVEILKALYRGADILILDEPTAVLTPQEADELFAILRDLRDEGKTVVLITHKLREIMAVTDTVTVMRDGEIIETLATGNTDTTQLAELMIGRRLQPARNTEPAKGGAPILELRNVTAENGRGRAVLQDIDITIGHGEIVGLAGVSGNGQTELLEVIAGLRPITEGQVAFRGEPVIDADRGCTASELRARGLGIIAEDRLRQAVVPGMTAVENALLGYQDRADYCRHGILQWAAVRSDCIAWIQDYDVRPALPDLRLSQFSGGNQQKLVLAREVEHDPVLLIAGQPTRGVDIGAAEFMRRQLLGLRDRGTSILLISVEIDEILALSDRIIVMHAGRISGRIEREKADERTLGLMMAGEAVPA